MQYGPKGECWDYDKKWKYIPYKDGEAQINNTIWSQDEAKTRYNLEQKENKSK